MFGRTGIRTDEFDEPLKMRGERGSLDPYATSKTSHYNQTDWYGVNTLKQDLQKLIDDAAEKFIKQSLINVVDGKRGFKAGCEFLMPLVDALITNRDTLIATREGWNPDVLEMVQDHNKTLLNLLRGER